MEKIKELIKAYAAKYFFPILNRHYKKTNHYLNDFYDVRKFWGEQAFQVHIQRNLEVVNLGSNHPKFAFSYNDFGIKGDNWAVGPQTLEYDFKILRKYHSFLAPDATVIIPICLFKMFLYRQKPRYFHYKYYTFLSPVDIVGYSLDEMDVHINRPLYYNWRLSKCIFHDVPPYTLLDLIENPLNNENALNADAQSWVDCWNKEFDIDIDHIELSESNKADIEKNIEILSSIIDFCLERNYHPVIALLPITDYLMKRLPSDFCNKYYINFINKANKRNVPILNYLTDSRFTSPDFFINSFFMNKRGRTVFTKQILKDLELI